MAQRLQTRSFSDLYDLEDVIGEGGTGNVYECIRKRDETRYAVKICVANDTKCSERTKREITICQLLDHENIVKLVEWFENQGVCHLVFELMDDGDVFDDIVAKKTYMEFDASFCIDQVFKGVQYLHNNNIIHRDLKLENLLLRRGGHGLVVKICDFGSAIQSEGKIKGVDCRMTKSYTAPEVLLGQRYWCPIDMWACGVILYVFLFGKRPFRGRTSEELKDKIIRGHYEFPDNKHREPVGEEAKELVRLLINGNEEARYTVQQALNHNFIKLRDEALPQPCLSPMPSHQQSKSEECVADDASSRLNKNTVA